MGRTNVFLDDELVREGLERTGAKTIRALVDRALRELIARQRRLDILGLAGCGWEGDLGELRGDADAADDR